MGEYATRLSDGLRVKIGTCEDLYYIRYEDADRVDYRGGFEGSRFRLPFPDEDDVRIGEYTDFNRGIKLYKSIEKPSRYHEGAIEREMIPFAPDHEPQHATIQLHHESGLLVNITCSHGAKLPENTKDVRFFWNGKTPINYELSSIKLQEGRAWACYRCRWCGLMWRAEITEILEYIPDKTLRERVAAYMTKEA